VDELLLAASVLSESNEGSCAAELPEAPDGGGLVNGPVYASAEAPVELPPPTVVVDVPHGDRSAATNKSAWFSSAPAASRNETLIKKLPLRADRVAINPLGLV